MSDEMANQTPETHVIEFEDASYWLAEGINVTVRLGSIWAERVHPNDRLLPKRASEAGTPLPDGQNRVIGVFNCLLVELPAALLKHETVPARRTKRGLIVDLDRVHGAVPLGHRIVTALVWIRETRMGSGPWGSD